MVRSTHNQTALTRPTLGGDRIAQRIFRQRQLHPADGEIVCIQRAVVNPGDSDGDAGSPKMPEAPLMPLRPEAKT